MSETHVPHVHGGGIHSEALTRKLGPLPVWAWGAVIIGVFVGWRFYQSRASGGDTTGSATDSSADDGSSAVSPSTDGGAGSDSVDTGQGGATTIQNPDTPKNNAQWAVLGERYLVAAGYTPITASNALAAYLAGRTLTHVQGTLVNKVLSGIGAPPQGLIAVKVAPKPSEPPKKPANPPKPSQPKKETRTVHVTANGTETKASLSVQYFGSDGFESHIHGAAGVGNHTKIKRGTKLEIVT